MGSAAERQAHVVLDPTAGVEHHLRFWVPPTVQGQPYWLSQAALIPYGAPLKIEIDAVMYAQNGSWFVIPPRWFNEQEDDSRPAFAARNGLRAFGTQPDHEGAYPFYHEPLNLDIEIHGAITENMPAEPADRAAWTQRLWMRVPEANSGQARTDFDRETPGFHPRIRYFYEHNLRRFVRYRIVNPVLQPANGIPLEGIAWSATPVPPPGVNVPSLDQVVAQARTDWNGYVVSLPILPMLPAGPVIYEGSIVQ
jgi:hypothetical protein